MKISNYATSNYYKLRNTPIVNIGNNSITFLGSKNNDYVDTTKSQSTLFSKMKAMTISARTSMKELFFNKVLDVSTVEQIKQKAIYFGEALAKNIYRNNGKFNQQEIEELVLKHLDKKHSKNVQVVTDEKGFCEFAEKYMKLNREYAKSVFQKSEGLAAQSSSGKLVFLLKLEGKEPEIAVNIATHEFEHLLYKTSGFIGKLIKKHLSEETEKEKMEKSIAESCEMHNKKFFKLQNALAALIIGKNAISTPFEYIEQEATIEGLIELSPVLSTKADLDKCLERYIRKNLICTNFDDSNFAELLAFEMVLRDEARAYEAGGKAQKSYNKLTGKNYGKTTMAEMVAVIYTQMANKIQEYKKLVIQNSLKESLGMKTVDYHESINDSYPTSNQHTTCS